MGDKSERERILDMLEAGKITAAEAGDLLRALKESRGPTSGEAVGIGLLSRLAAVFKREDRPSRTEVKVGRFAGPDPIELNVENVNGRISIEGVSGDEYEVGLAYFADEGDVPFEVSEQDRSLTVKVRRTRFDMDSVRIRIRVPEKWKYDVAASTGNGRVQLQGLKLGKVTAKTANGRIEVRECVADDAELKTRNGRVVVEAGAGRLVAESVNGRIHLAPDPGVSGAYELVTTAGSIQCALKQVENTGYRVSGTASTGRVRVAQGLDVVENVERGVGGFVRAETPGFEDRETKIQVNGVSRVGRIEFGVV